MSAELKGRVSSLQSLGTLDGPGVRFVVFLQGCPLRCACCHNPETQPQNGGRLYTPGQLLQQILRYRDYFGPLGGVTLSGGEPLLQPEFTAEVFKLCQNAGVHTCLDTSGALLSGKILPVLQYTNYCLLDVKFTTESQYQQYAGCTLQAPLAFLKELNRRQIPTRLRQVIIPGLNNNPQNVLRLKQIANAHPCVQEVELLPFEKLCQTKYQKLGRPFALQNTPPANPAEVAALQKLLCK